jgi:hypothetical protein
VDHFEGVGHWTAVVAVLVGVLSVARTARLLTYDDFPPVKWLRTRYLAAVGPDGKWAPLATCPFCLAPYLAAGMLAWAYLSGLHWSWWVVNGWWAGSYVAAMVVAYDEPPEE